jgi:hypothetical protein
MIKTQRRILKSLPFTWLLPLLDQRTKPTGLTYHQDGKKTLRLFLRRCFNLRYRSAAAVP